MGDIKISKKTFTKTVEGSKSLGHARLTVRGKKRPLSVSYEVLVEEPGETPFRTKGSYIRVRMEMEKNEKAKEGAGLLREVAGKMQDPKGSMSGNFDDSQLSCLAVLTEGERSIKGIVSSSGLGAYQISKALAGLQSSNLVCRCEKKGEAERRYRLTESGKRMTELLREEEPFLKIKRNIKRKKEERASSSHDIHLNENELLCLVLLDKGPKTTRGIEEITGMEQEEAVKTMDTLESWGIAKKEERLSDKNWRWSITATGEHHIEVLKDNEKFIEARERLRQESTDPSRRFSKYFKEEELLCIAVLEDGPKTVREITEATGLKESEAFLKVNILYSGGILTQEGAGEECRYAIDETGKHYLEWLRKEDRFQEIRKKVETK